MTNSQTEEFFSCVVGLLLLGSLARLCIALPNMRRTAEERSTRGRMFLHTSLRTNSAELCVTVAGEFFAMAAQNSALCQQALH